MIAHTDVDNTNNNIDATQVNDFLAIGIPFHKDEVNMIGIKETGLVTKWVTPELLKDIVRLTPGELRKKYPRTYKSWDNMKQRKKKGAIIHLEFDNFKDFLRHVGPCENPKYTLDRINNDDLEYAPGKVQWRDKHAQNSNKGNNVYLTHDDGRRFTIAQWAKITKQHPSTLYKRYNSGWSDMETITGKKIGSNLLKGDNLWPYEKKKEWELKFRRATLYEGFKGDRLQFLYEDSMRNLNALTFKEEKLSLAVCRAQGFTDPNEQGGFEMFIEHRNINLKCYEGIDASELSKRYSKTVIERKGWLAIYAQAKEMYKYQEKLKALVSTKGSYLTQEDVLEELHSFFPKPKYTLHLPPNGTN